MKKNEVKNENKDTNQKKYVLTDEQTIRFYKTLIQIFEDRTNTKVTCTIKLSA